MQDPGPALIPLGEWGPVFCSSATRWLERVVPDSGSPTKPTPRTIMPKIPSEERPIREQISRDEGVAGGRARQAQAPGRENAPARARKVAKRVDGASPARDPKPKAARVAKTNAEKRGEVPAVIDPPETIRAREHARNPEEPRAWVPWGPVIWPPLTEQHRGRLERDGVDHDWDPGSPPTEDSTLNEWGQWVTPVPEGTEPPRHTEQDAPEGAVRNAWGEYVIPGGGSGEDIIVTVDGEPVEGE